MRFLPTILFRRFTFLAGRARRAASPETSVGPRRPSAEPLEVRRLFSGAYVYEQLASFGSSTGASSPAGQIVMDKSGNLYGFTSAGGTNSTGVAFEVQQGNSTPVTLASFPAAAAGTSLTVTGPVIDTKGDLFGVTTTGGDADQDGTVFEIVTGSTAITTLGTFNSATTGSSPGGTLIIDSSGDLFGTTANGGANGCGTVWELAAGGSAIVLLASFSPVTVNGVIQNPGANSIAMDGSGNFFGTTGGNAAVGSDGTVWELASGSATIQTLASFTGANGITPVGGVAVDGNGNVFGVTQFGGNDVSSTSAPLGTGVVWELPSGLGQIAALTSFDNPPGGEFPIGGVILDRNDNLFGTTSAGGDVTSSFAGDGTVWEIPARSVSVTTIETFVGTNGATPHGGLLIDKFGNVFGTTTLGGANAGGSVFELDLGGATQSAAALSLTIARSTLPASIPAGTNARGSATVDVGNQAMVPARGVFTIRVYTSSDGLIDSTATQIGTITRAIEDPRGATAVVNVPISSFPTGAVGQYTLLAQATDGEGNTSGTGAGPTITVATPFIALTESLTRITLPTTIVSGSKVRAQANLSIRNSGNIAVNGPVTIELDAVPAGSSIGSVPITSVTRRLVIPPGHSTTVIVPLTSIPSGLSGMYNIAAQVTDPMGGTSRFSSTSTYTISPPVVTLNATIDSFEPTTFSATSEMRGSVSVTISNNGNIPVGGNSVTDGFEINLGLVSQDGSQMVLMESFARAMLLNPGQSRALKLSFSTTTPMPLVAGNYFPTIAVTLAGTSYSTTVTGPQSIAISS
jgi:uncharacterized repeat protein (TIGR03803 family)